jgi:hypothetical protein
MRLVVVCASVVTVLALTMLPASSAPENRFPADAGATSRR